LIVVFHVDHDTNRFDAIIIIIIIIIDFRRFLGPGMASCKCSWYA
jgi:hypothetical protein